MSKTKAVKREEAIARLRSRFHRHIAHWIEVFDINSAIAKVALSIGQNHYEKMKVAAERKLVAAAKEANVDRYGNSLN